MAARKRLNHVQKTREKIQTSMLINRLLDHALADEDVMTPSQVNAAKILIAKTLPDMKSIEVAVQDEQENWIKELAQVAAKPTVKKPAKKRKKVTKK